MLQVTWDGIGWALAQYDGNKTGAQQMYAEQYLTILPWLGAGECAPLFPF